MSKSSRNWEQKRMRMWMAMLEFRLLIVQAVIFLVDAPPRKPLKEDTSPFFPSKKHRLFRCHFQNVGKLYPCQRSVIAS